MSRTTLNSLQLRNDAVQRDDLNTDIPGQAVVTNLIPGKGIEFDSTGADAGTGTVTVNVKSGMFQHNQLVPEAVWSIQHDLDCYPRVVAFDSSGDDEPMFGDVSYPDRNNAILTFSGAMGGRAELYQ
jgi:hypothetical protein